MLTYRNQVGLSPRLCELFCDTYGRRGPDDLLVRLNCTGLCMSDVHYMLKDLAMGRYMEDFGVRSPGHEGAGVVVKVGSQYPRGQIRKFD